MSEMRKTGILVGAAVVLVVIAAVTAPKYVAPDAFFDEGEEFFPGFDDPNAARTLEVIEFDQATGAARPFKVTFKDGEWTIPSHHDYPADGKDRLAQTAAGLIGITKDDFRTDNPADYAACGVIDPLDESNPSASGRGTRVTIRGDNDVVLADILIGKSFEGREGFRLVRVPDQKRVYGTKIGLSLSTRFKDWIESDLMLIEKDEIDRVVLRDYSIDERTGRLDERDTVVLTREGEDWTMDGTPAGKEVERFKVTNLVSAIDGLSIEGVRPKPAGISASLSKAEGGMSVSQGELLSLQGVGYYFTRDGRLVSNEGELQVQTSDGVAYTLRFGEVVFGTGLSVTAGVAAGQSDGGDAGENRYLMITTSFDPTQFPEPDKPGNTDFENKPDSLWTEDDYVNRGKLAEWQRWKDKVESGRDRSETLNDRFANWYYVISSESFDKLHLVREDFLRDKRVEG